MGPGRRSTERRLLFTYTIAEVSRSGTPAMPRGSQASACGTPQSVRVGHMEATACEFRPDFRNNSSHAVAPILLCFGAIRNHMANLKQQVSGFVLVVDDDEGVRRVLSRWVADMGYTVQAAADADSALDIMREHQVDVALVDVRMPGHDGIWLLDQVRRLFPETATVLATGLVEMDPMVTLRPGVVGYIVKPFNRDDLAKVINRGIVERRRLQAEHRSHPRLLSDSVLDGIVVSTD
jgi:CheY-like chemotaxis protein